MRFTLAFISFISAAMAQAHNAFNIPTSGNYVGVTAGQPTTFTWSNPSSGTITLNLRSGASSNLMTVMVLESNVANTGSYTWNVPSTLPEGADYALEIVDDSDTSDINYTGQFVISSNVKAVATSGGSTSLVTATTAGTASASSMATTSAASMTSGATTMATSTGSASGSSAASSGASSSAASSSAASSSAAAKTSATTSGAATAVTQNAAAANGVKAASGLFAVALGFAIAL